LRERRARFFWARAFCPENFRFLAIRLEDFFRPGSDLSDQVGAAPDARSPKFIDYLTIGADQLLIRFFFFLFRLFFIRSEIFLRDEMVPAIPAKLFFFAIFDVATQADEHLSLSRRPLKSRFSLSVIRDIRTFSEISEVTLFNHYMGAGFGSGGDESGPDASEVANLLTHASVPPSS